MRRHSFTSGSARRPLCVAGIVGFVALALCSDATVFPTSHIMNIAKAEGNLVGALYPRLGDEGPMPDLDGAIGWLNSAPLMRLLREAKPLTEPLFPDQQKKWAAQSPSAQEISAILGLRRNPHTRRRNFCQPITAKRQGDQTLVGVAR